MINLSDLLLDGSHTLSAVAENDVLGPNQHLQLSIKSSGVEVQTIDLDNIVVDVSNAAAMLNSLLVNDSIKDGVV